MVQITRATPRVEALGIDDKSIRAMPNQREAVPTFLAHVYGYAPKGPLTPELVSGASLANLYGPEVVDEIGPYATHASVLLKLINATGTAVMFQRVLPVDAGPKASLRWYVDVLVTRVPEYRLLPDGNYELDEYNDPIPTGQYIDGGVKMFHVMEEVGLDALGDDSFGGATQKRGTQVDPDTGELSIRYPIMDLRVAFHGAYGSNIGIHIWAPHSNSKQPFHDGIFDNVGAYPFRFSFVERDRNGLPNKLDTLAGDKFIDAVFMPGAIDKVTGDREVSIHKLIKQEYEAVGIPGETDRYGPFSETHVYDDNVEEIVDLIYAAESRFMMTDFNSDFIGADNEKWLVNFVSARSSKGLPYHSVIIDNSDMDSVSLIENAAHFAQGGSDGTMNEEEFAKLVSREVREYANPDSPLQEVLRYPQSVILDSGFPLETKYDLLSMIAIRKDTAVFLSTHDVLGRELTSSEDSSIGLSLKSRAQLYPESEYYGTETVRAFVCKHSGQLLNSKYTKPLPLLLEVVTNCANYMGASNGKWKPEYRFDNSPGSIVKMFANVSNPFAPARVRNRDWANGLNWVQAFELKSLFFPALKTVYGNDTSVLNSLFTMLACVELQKVGYRAWKQITGTSFLTPLQIIEENNRNINDDVEGRFDDRFVITPNTYYTEEDMLRGYSHHTKIIIEAPNMATVSVLTIEARRLED